MEKRLVTADVCVGIEMANWLVTVDYEQFDLASAYDVLPRIYWKNDVKSQNKGLQPNDIVYVYVTGETAKVMYQMKVVVAQVENYEYPETQKVFWIDKAQIEEYKGKYSILEKLNKVDKVTLTRKNLIQEQLISKAPIQGRTTDNPKGKKPEEAEAHKKLLAFIADQFTSEVKSFDYPDEANLENQSFPEGAKKTVQVNRYERNPEARAKCIKIHGTRCKICEMSFAETYGTFAKDFIHVHHITSLSEISDSYEVNPETDLLPVCPNCHAMLHRQENGIPMTVERLKLLYEVSKNSN